MVRKPPEMGIVQARGDVATARVRRSKRAVPTESYLDVGDRSHQRARGERSRHQDARRLSEGRRSPSRRGPSDQQGLRERVAVGEDVLRNACGRGLRPPSAQQRGGILTVAGFSCLAGFSLDEIGKWTDEFDRVGVTALCSSCGDRLGFGLPSGTLVPEADASSPCAVALSTRDAFPCPPVLPMLPRSCAMTLSFAAGVSVHVGDVAGRLTREVRRRRGRPQRAGGRSRPATRRSRRPQRVEAFPSKLRG